LAPPAGLTGLDEPLDAVMLPLPLIEHYRGRGGTGADLFLFSKEVSEKRLIPLFGGWKGNVSAQSTFTTLRKPLKGGLQGDLEDP
jgi:hypothetical protein